MRAAAQWEGLPLFAVLRPTLEPRRCAYCQTMFTPERVNLTHQKFCTIRCQTRARNLRRTQEKQPPDTLRQPALPAACQCGAALMRCESDWMTGQTFEVCARGHRINPVLRRYAA